MSEEEDTEARELGSLAARTDDETKSRPTPERTDR